jgi:hypothetical protein
MSTKRILCGLRWIERNRSEYTTAPPAFDFLNECGTPEKVLNATGNFMGWLVPTDNSNLLEGVQTPKWTLTGLGCSSARSLAGTRAYGEDNGG